MGMKRNLAALLLLTLAAPAWGQDYEKALRAYDQRDYRSVASMNSPQATTRNST